MAAPARTVVIVELVPLQRAAAERFAPALAGLLTLIPLVTYTPADVLAADKGGVPLVGRWQHSLVAVHDGAPIGGLLTYERPPEPAAAATAGRVVYPARSFYLDGLAVAPQWQRRGVATALLHAWLRSTAAGFAAHPDPVAWSLQTNADPSNAGVAAFYAREGFGLVGGKDYPNRRDLVMWRPARRAAAV